MRFNIGYKAWWATCKTTEEWIKCQECFGLKYLVVILGDQTEVKIECEGCRRGYLGSLGSVSYWKHSATAELVTIERVEIKKDGIEYGVNGSYCVNETELFAEGERDLAEIRALELSEQWNKEQEAKIYKKVKDHRSWSWHVHYHRDCIRKAEKDIAYHKSCLDYAKKVSNQPAEEGK